MQQYSLIINLLPLIKKLCVRPTILQDSNQHRINKRNIRLTIALASRTILKQINSLKHKLNKNIRLLNQ